jgi:hypothetical protein
VLHDIVAAFCDSQIREARLHGVSGPNGRTPIGRMSAKRATPPCPVAQEQCYGLLGGQDLHTHARSQPLENDHEPTHGRSPVWRAHPALVPLTTCRDATQASMWAKPCLAGRPTMLVRTQCCEKNTSRGRPTGMELPDYPVMALTPARWTRMGPHFRFPPGLFPYS